MASENSSPSARPVTQKQIAERVGVTQQLVALALKDSPNVAASTKEKILAVASELGYRQGANHGARLMAAARHGTRVRNHILAVVFETMTVTPLLDKPYFMPFVAGIEAEADSRKIDLFLVRPKPSGLPWLIREGWVDGVILLGSHASASDYSELQLPVLTLGSHLPDIAGITPDNQNGMMQATQHLIGLSHRKIAYLGPHSQWPSSSARFEGYQCALQNAGIAPDDNLVELTLSQPLEADGETGMARLMERADFTALVCHNDPTAMGAIRVAQRAGRIVPDDLSVTGFDDVSIATGFAPAITSVGFSYHAMGRAAVRMILDEPSGAEHKQFPVELQIHQSTGKVSS